jgi:hypothetical protein
LRELNLRIAQKGLKMAERRAGWVKPVVAAICLYSVFLFVLGVGCVRDFWEYRESHHDWQEVGSVIALLTFLPATLLGIKLPKFATWWCFALTVLCVMQVLGITAQTGDGTAGAMIGIAGIVGLPALAAGLTFRSLSESKGQSRKPTHGQ